MIKHANLRFSVYEKPGPQLMVVPLSYDVNLSIQYPRGTADERAEEYRSRSEHDRIEPTFLVIDEYHKLSIMTASELEKRGYVRVELE